MPLSPSATPDNGQRDSVEGVVITERLVATSPGSAGGTFNSVGAITGTGTVVTGAWASLAGRDGGDPLLVEGSERLVTAAGELWIELRASLRSVPGTGVLTGGGSWNVRAATGEFDGTRAAGTLTITATIEGAGATTLELMLTGRVPSSGPGRGA